MHTVRTIADLRAAVAAWRADGLSVGLVPTMGGLHEGHLSLIRLAREHADREILELESLTDRVFDITAVRI